MWKVIQTLVLDHQWGWLGKRRGNQAGGKKTSSFAQTALNSTDLSGMAYWYCNKQCILLGISVYFLVSVLRKRQMLSTIIILTTPLRDLFKMTTSKLRGKTGKVEKQAKLIHSLWILASFNYSLACSEMFQTRSTSFSIFSLSHPGHVCSVSEVQFFT